jgi:VanZ family protein
MILWALFVFTLCAIPLNEVNPSPIFFPGFDKLVHCGFFFVFTVLYSYGLIRQHNLAGFAYKYAIMVLLLALLYGGAIEILQATVFTWRDGDWNDFFADTVGACMGMFSVLVTATALKNGKK